MIYIRPERGEKGENIQIFLTSTVNIDLLTVLDLGAIYRCIVSIRSQSCFCAPNAIKYAENGKILSPVFVIR